jgi:hypothetical protein
MKRAFAVLPFVAVLALSAAALARPAPSDPSLAEVPRIRAHFHDVRRELLARDVSGLTDAQRANRERAIAALGRYAEAGVFPHNHRAAGAGRVPFFVDEHGTLCAVAFLIAESGRRDLVDRVAATRNNASVRELASDSQVVAWLDANGITAYEAGRIQPFYGEEPPIVERDDEVPGELMAGTAALGMASVWASAGNWHPAGSERAVRTRGFVGLLSGAAQMALGASYLDDDGDAATVGAVNLGVGAIATALGLRVLLSGGGRGAPAGEARVAPAAGATVTAAPMATAAGGAGVSFNVRF